MNGENTKYYKYKSSGSGTITIPIAIAKALNWNHQDSLSIVLKTKDGQIGIFVFKKETEGNKDE